MKKKMTAWTPGVGASGRQSIVVILIHTIIISDRLLGFNGFFPILDLFALMMLRREEEL